VATNSSSKYFVKIQIAATSNSNPKEFLLSRFQFELLFFSLPIIVLWGLISTLILFKNLYFNPPTATLEKAPSLTQQNHAPVVDTNPLPTAIEESAQKKSILAESADLPASLQNLEANPKDTVASAVKEVVQEKQTSIISQPVIRELAARSFRVDDIFDVDVSLSKRTSSSSYAMTIAMTNLKSATESGRYWISVLATTDTGKKVWLTPMPEVKINSSGQADQPRRGWAYAFRHFRKNSLELKNVKVKVARFDEVMIGFEREGNSPAIAKVQLIAR
jgi:hypothetical protein